MAVLLLVLIGGGAGAENWIANGDFEADDLHWPGAVIQTEVVHSGNRALRLDLPAGREKISAPYEGGVEVGQTQAETIMAAFWMRFDATRQTGAVRGGISFTVSFEGEDGLAWYGPFALSPQEMGSWVYREARWKPRAPVSRLRPAIYLQGVEGTIYLDDLYLGPPLDLPRVPRTTIPVAVTGTAGRFTDWPRVRIAQLTPAAHVFHLAGENRSNLQLSGELEVISPAPAYLTSAWGAQYWTLYSPARRELAEIYTDERLDLSQAGRQSVTLPMNGFSDGAYDLAPGDYVFVTDRFKSFLIYGTDHPTGEPYRDARTGATYNFWDSVKIDPLSRAWGPLGVAGAFALADLSSYRLQASAIADAQVVAITPVLVDAGGVAVPLHGLELSARTDTGGEVALPEEVAEDGVPTGRYLWPAQQATPEKLRVLAQVRLAAPEGLKQELLDQEVTVQQATAQPAVSPAPLVLVGWGGGHYDLATSALHARASARELVADAKAAGVKRLVVHARGSRDDAYHSAVSLMTPPEADALQAVCAEGKAQGVEIYAGYILGIAQEVDLKQHPDWAQLDRAGKQTGWYCYNNPQVHDFHQALMTELVTKYDIAGIAVDYCRPGTGCYCERCQELFRAKYGRELLQCDAYDADWREFQRTCITEWLRELSATVHRARADARFAGYVWGRLAPEADRAGQDWPRWLAEGIMDWVCVGQYTTSTPFFRSQCHTLKLIADRYLGGDTSRICPLLGVSYIQEAYVGYALADEVINRHLWAAREEGMSMAGYFPFSAIRTHTGTSARHARQP